VQTLPSCELGCELDEFCTFDSACQPTCERICDLACAADEVCYFPVPDNPACKKIEYFDAGALNFTGTTVPITLFPPYVFAGDVTGALYLPDSEITVHASGTTEAGFEEFEASFQTTTYIDTQIETLGLEQIYGSDDLPVTWVAGADEVEVRVTVAGLLGSYGLVTCPAQDGDGSLGVPRDAIVYALVEGEELGSLHVSVQRERTDVQKGLSTAGTLLDQTVQPEGWLELSSTSVEEITLEGCAGLAYCEGECVDINWTNEHCGSCGNNCEAWEACEAGECESTCSKEETPCDGVCTVTAFDEEHCGGCDTACGDDEVCIDGDCVEGSDDPGNCCASHAGAGCTNPAIEACVCAQDSFCCDNTWDGTCAGEVESLGCGMC